MGIEGKGGERSEGKEGEWSKGKEREGKSSTGKKKESERIGLIGKTSSVAFPLLLFPPSLPSFSPLLLSPPPPPHTEKSILLVRLRGNLGTVSGKFPPSFPSPPPAPLPHHGKYEKYKLDRKLRRDLLNMDDVMYT